MYEMNNVAWFRYNRIIGVQDIHGLEQPQLLVSQRVNFPFYYVLVVTAFRLHLTSELQSV